MLFKDGEAAKSSWYDDTDSDWREVTVTVENQEPKIYRIPSIWSPSDFLETHLMVVCKYCGQQAVKWNRIGGKWILYNTTTNTPHHCIKQDIQDKSPEPVGEVGKIEMDPNTGGPVELDAISEAEQDMQNMDGGNSDKNSDKEGSPSNGPAEGEKASETPGNATDFREVYRNLPKPLKQMLKQGHKQSLQLFFLLGAGMKVYVAGPAGSGKTTAFKLITPALGHHFQRDDYDFYFKSVCDLTGKHEFEGFINAAGQIVDTDFRKAYIEGHLYLVDEVDASNANVLTVMNATIENGWASFPDGKYPQHPHFRIGVAANTVGLGGDAVYIGRNALDGAFRNRFFFLPWEYDEELETRLAGADQMEWIKRVQTIRKAHLSLGKLAPRIIVSPRASINGAILLRNNIIKKFPALEDALIWQGCSEDDKQRVLKAIK